MATIATYEANDAWRTPLATKHSPGWRIRQGRERGWLSETPILDGNGALLALLLHANDTSTRAPNADQQDMLTLFGSIVGNIAERKQQELANAALMRAQLLTAATEERSRISRELHDSVSQSLFGIVLGVRTIKQNGLKDDRTNSEALDYIFAQSETALSDMRSLVMALRPEALENEGFLIAFRRQIELLIARSPHRVVLNLGEEEPDMDFSVKECLYRIGLEAVQNSLRHANATRIDIALRRQPDALEFEISDDGIGFDARQKKRGHFGLQTMRERAEAEGGTIEIDSGPNSGTRVRVMFSATR
jgi:signal transduction histidine kinase